MEDNHKKRMCRAIIIKWKTKYILHGFREWKKYSNMIMTRKFEKDIETSKREMKEKENILQDQLKEAKATKISIANPPAF